MKYSWSDFQLGPEKGTIAAEFVEVASELSNQANQPDQANGSHETIPHATALAIAFLGLLGHEYVRSVASCRPGQLAKPHPSREPRSKRRRRLKEERKQRTRGGAKWPSK